MEDFLTRVARIAAAHPRGILLREKDLSESAYRELAREVLAICQNYKTPCILHSFAGAAAELACPSLHLPLPALRALSAGDRTKFTTLGASCHSVGEALEAEALGCTYITAGHIFSTACKQGLPGRGIAFLRQVCGQVSIPVYGIGGICPENIADVRSAGAAGACVMSGAMLCRDVPKYLAAFEERNR